MSKTFLCVILWPLIKQLDLITSEFMNEGREGVGFPPGAHVRRNAAALRFHGKLIIR